MVDEEVRQVLLRMKAELSNGWVQGELHKGDGVCLYGALVRAADTPTAWASSCPTVKGRDVDTSLPTYVFRWDDVSGRTVKLLADTLGIDYSEMALWNDDPDRTAEDVTGLVDRALASLAPEPAASHV